MARTFRNLSVALGVVFSDRGIGTFEKKMRSVEQRLEKVDRVARRGAGLMAVAGGATSAGAAVAPLAGAVLALPGALAIAKAAAVTAKVAFLGMGEAMEAVASGNAEDLNAALVKLSPNAQKVVREANRLFGSFKELQQTVQDQVFAGLDKELRPVANSLLPEVRQGMIGVGAAFNTGAKEAARFGATPMAKGAVNEVFRSTGRVMGTLASATQPALQVITQLAVKALPLAERMATWATNGVKAAAGFLTSERGASMLTRTVDRTGDTLAQMGRIGGNTIKGLVGLFSQAKGSGDGVLDSLEQMTAKFAAWSRSVEGQQQAAETFSILRDAARAVVDVLPLVLGPLGALMQLINGLPDPLQSGVVQFLAFSVVIGSLTGRLRPLITAVSNVTDAFTNSEHPLQRFRDRVGGIEGAMTKTRTGLSRMAGMLTMGGPWAIALGLGVAAVGLFASKQMEADGRVRDLTETLDKQSGAITGDTRAMVVSRLEQEGLLKVAQDLGIGLGTVTDAALGKRDAMTQVNGVLDRYGDRLRDAAAGEQLAGAGTDQLAMGAGDLRRALEGQNVELNEAIAASRRSATAMGTAATAGHGTADSIAGVGAAAGRTATQVNAVNRALSAFKSFNGDADQAAIGFRDSLDTLSEALGRNARGIDHRTGKVNMDSKAGRANVGMVMDSIQAAITHSEKVYTQSRRIDDETTAVGKANRAFNTHIERLRGVLEKAGLSKTAIDKLIARYATMPAKINGATSRIKDRKIAIEVKVGDDIVGYRVGVRGSTGTILRASGGILPGWSPGRDTHMFYSPTGGKLGLSGGEAVMRPEWTAAVGPAAIDQMNKAARTGGVGGVKRVLASGIGRHQLGGEGAFFADGGIIHTDKFTGLDRLPGRMSKVNTMYGDLATWIAKDVTKKLNQSYSGGPAVARTLTWARQQAGKPYIWGGVGPTGYDCSGLWSVVVRHLKGMRPLHARMFSTHSFGGVSGPGGFERGRSSAVRVGVTDAGVGHMAGTLGKVNFESRGSRGVVIGPGARGADDGLFTRRYGLRFDEGGVMPPGHGTYYNGTRKPEYVFTKKQMEQGGGPGGKTVIENHFHLTPFHNAKEVGKEVYEVLEPYMRTSKRKLPV